MQGPGALPDPAASGRVVHPDPGAAARYDTLYQEYRHLVDTAVGHWQAGS
ncbi:protein of unknown function [Candidatus Hydrogenisulfobacillus filiaventi]|uniref:Uncharacterized protein n=1 Tax=Candidatus Hydrogenisulfobacillus filiaventi TaxID=2707344 RepID=A0A6F8ZD79_9FIRM|nr:protein of unknown function [Candidatus Hydrogenisulfobacillus filiaventi]